MYGSGSPKVQLLLVHAISRTIKLVVCTRVAQPLAVASPTPSHDSYPVDTSSVKTNEPLRRTLAVFSNRQKATAEPQIGLTRTVIDIASTLCNKPLLSQVCPTRSCPYTSTKGTHFFPGVNSSPNTAFPAGVSLFAWRKVRQTAQAAC